MRVVASRCYSEVREAIVVLIHVTRSRLNLFVDLVLDLREQVNTAAIHLDSIPRQPDSRKCMACCLAPSCFPTPGPWIPPQEDSQFRSSHASFEQLRGSDWFDTTSCFPISRSQHCVDAFWSRTTAKKGISISVTEQVSGDTHH